MQIATVNLSKRYGAHWAIRQLDLQLPTQSVIGFLGPNGAGKTTVFRLLSGLLLPTTGTIRFSSTSQRPLQLGAVLDNPGFMQWMTARENLFHLGSITGPTTSDMVTKALVKTDLLAAADRPAGQFSTGMSKRLAIANAILHNPDVLLFDEPFEGLDPEARILLRKIISDTAANGRTILISSHQLKELEDICSHVVFIYDGVLVCQDSLAALLSTSKTNEVVIEVGNVERAEQVVNSASVPYRIQSDRIILSLRRAEIPATVAQLCAKEVEIYSVTTTRLGLEDMYVAMAQKASLPDDRQSRPSIAPTADHQLALGTTSFPAAVALELRKLFGRRRTMALLCVPSFLLLVLTPLLATVPLFLGGFRMKLVIPIVTGCFTITLSFSRYLFPIVLAILTVGSFTGEANNGIMATTLLTGLPRRQLFAAKIISLITFVFAALALMPLLYVIDVTIAWLVMEPAWWRAYALPIGKILYGFFWLLCAYGLAQVCLIAYWCLFAARGRSVVRTLITGMVPLAAMALLGVLSSELLPLIGLSFDPAPSFFTSQYAAVGDFDLLHGVFNHGLRNWPPHFLRDMLLLACQGALCCLLALYLFLTRDFPGGRND